MKDSSPPFGPDSVVKTSLRSWGMVVAFTAIAASTWGITVYKLNEQGKAIEKLQSDSSEQGARLIRMDVNLENLMRRLMPRQFGMDNPLDPSKDVATHP